MSVNLASRRLVVAVVAVSALVAPAACSGDRHDMAGMADASSAAPMPGMPAGMPGMDHAMARGDGTAAAFAGYTLHLDRPVEPAATAANLTFQITAGGRPVTAYTADQTKLMHLYLVRSDLTGFQHVHPRMAADGTWTAPLGPLAPGRYRVYTAFVPAGGPATDTAVVLGAPVTVPGTPTRHAPPARSATATVDGYRVTVAGHVTVGTESPLRVTFVKNGTPVTDLQPYLDSYAHLTAVHAGDLAFAHLHPSGTVRGDHGGPALDFSATLPAAGDWRLFLQFQASGVLHTAALSVVATR